MMIQEENENTFLNAVWKLAPMTVCFVYKAIAAAAAVAAKSLQSCPTLCDPIDGRKTSISALLITPKPLTV